MSDSLQFLFLVIKLFTRVELGGLEEVQVYLLGKKLSVMYLVHLLMSMEVYLLVGPTVFRDPAEFRRFGFFRGFLTRGIFFPRHSFFGEFDVFHSNNYFFTEKVAQSSSVTSLFMMIFFMVMVE